MYFGPFYWSGVGGMLELGGMPQDPLSKPMRNRCGRRMGKGVRVCMTYVGPHVRSNMNDSILLATEVRFWATW